MYSYSDYPNSLYDNEKKYKALQNYRKYFTILSFALLLVKQDTVHKTN